ncbi:MAG: hypothetical protein GXP04_05590, partial [Alphaproteobacteria bacterium]|nr:hypothetical protein [Alphaproteobacteria bacterium]
MSNIVVAALYQFTPLPDFKDRQAPLLNTALEQGVMGTILLASEGVNGTIAGSRAGINAILAHLKTFPGCANLEWKESYTDDNPFLR